MAAPTKNIGSSTETTLVVEWTALSGTDAGNSAVTSYELLWDNGLGTANIVLTDSLVTSYTLSALTGGASYIFKVRARNLYGDGDYSPEATLVASGKPATMATLTTSTVTATSTILIAWVAPADSSDAITAY